VANAALRWKPTDILAPGIQRGSDGVVGGGVVWVVTSDGKHVRPVGAQTGLTDGTLTEVSGPEVKEGMEVVTGQPAEGSPGVN